MSDLGINFIKGEGIWGCELPITGRNNKIKSGGNSHNGSDVRTNDPHICSESKNMRPDFH